MTERPRSTAPFPGRAPGSGLAPWTVVGVYATAVVLFLTPYAPYNRGEVVATLAALLLSILTFAVFGYDKRRAVKEATRVPERTLLLLAAAGGALGALAAMAAFRHKNRKTTFVVAIPIALFAHVALIGWWWIS